ncbi:hypothetical protein [Methylobacterium sp. WSM2598]|uniref:hypothetical protein n=1 Tax=Methylobacterium sp. WSM2598 TaxID=398261 RepID=UPI00039F6959|nr:hypothetical protein [Methylobacterium sp. WSM2598]
MSAEKIGPQHRARKAVLYVRQSSVQQVQHNRESQALQYAMRERLVGLGCGFRLKSATGSEAKPASVPI